MVLILQYVSISRSKPLIILHIKFVKRLLTFGMLVGKSEMFPLSWQGYSVVYCLSLGFHIHNVTC